jgi:putative ABC transport system permease protein
VKGVWLLSWRHMLHSRAQTVILVLCIAVSVFLPLTSQRLIQRYGTQLRARAATTPMLMGAIGNRFDLTLASLYFRQSRLDPIPWREYERLRDERMGLAVPIHVRFTARGAPISATTPEYFQRRGLVLSEGELPVQLGDAVLGATTARDLAIGPGDSLFSDQKEIYDISKPPALKMRVVGVHEPTGTADDDAVFVDINTAWLLEGFVHGHAEADDVVDPIEVYGRTEERVVFSEALMQYNEVTAQNAGSFHLHGDRAELPLTAVLFFPADEKAGTLVKARVNAEGELQMLVPTEVIDDLMAFVFRIKAIFDSLSAVLAASTVLLTLLVMLLSVRLRKGEIMTLHRIGCSRFTVAKLYAAELSLILATSVVIALVGVLAADALLPNLLRVL